MNEETEEYYIKKIKEVHSQDIKDGIEKYKKNTVDGGVSHIMV